MKIIQRPNEGEFAPHTKPYIALVPDGPIVAYLQGKLKTTPEFILAIPPDKLNFRWAEGEWTIKEILVHIIDSERIFCYRALRFARNDATELTMVDQDLYVLNFGANERKIEEILEEYTAVRQASLTFFNSLEEIALTRAGMVNGNQVSVRALAWLTAGHEIHHLKSIQENYL